jgi:hypothetical protein
MKKIIYRPTQLGKAPPEYKEGIKVECQPYGAGAATPVSNPMWIPDNTYILWVQDDIELTQTDIDALWLASMVDVNLPGVPAGLREGAAARLAYLINEGIVAT